VKERPAKAKIEEKPLSYNEFYFDENS